MTTPQDALAATDTLQNLLDHGKYTEVTAQSESESTTVLNAAVHFDFLAKALCSQGYLATALDAFSNYLKAPACQIDNSVPRIKLQLHSCVLRLAVARNFQGLNEIFGLAMKAYNELPNIEYTGD